MQFSHSRVDLFKQCPYRYKLRYLDHLKVLPDDGASNALYLGTALHTGLEKGLDAAISEYYSNYPVITDDHINEAMKLEYMIPKAKELLPDKGIYEQKILTSDFIGYMDLLVKVDEVKRRRTEIPVYDLYDFKYSNNVERYLESGQLHEYKYFFEKSTGFLIRNLYYVIVPKVQIKQKKTENLLQFRNRIKDELVKVEPYLVQVEYNQEKVIDFLMGVKNTLERNDYLKNNGYLCNWCDYQKFCETGEEYMLLPKSERRTLDSISKKTIWVYGAPFSGKTTLANQFPEPLMLNTDGNIKFVDAPFIAIKNEVKTEGRRTITTLAWDVFKDAIGELEKKYNDFKTIVVDLLEDTYEHCRIWCYEKLGIEHESDNSFKAWDYVRTQFLSTMKRLMNLDYENIILISHEDTSKDITKKTGDKITSIAPNLQPKTANKVAGMVDIVARVIADGDERTLNFKTNEVIFGGGRLKAADSVISLEYDALMGVYREAAETMGEAPKTAEKKPKRARLTKKAEEVETKTVYVDPPEQTEETVSEEEQQTHKRTRRRTKPETEEIKTEGSEPETFTEEQVEEKPKRTRRTRKVDPELEPETKDDDQPPFDVDEELVEEKPTRTRRTRKARD